MYLEIQLDTDTEEVNVNVDNYMTVSAHYQDTKIVFSKNIDRITDDTTHEVVTKICVLVLGMIENGG